MAYVTRLLAVMFFYSIFSVFSIAEAAPCGTTKLAEVQSQATSANPDVRINCDLTLSPNSILTKAFVISGNEANGTIIDCNGGTLNGGPGTVNYKKDMIRIASRKMSGTEWVRPENITIRNCKINGSLRLYGMGSNGQDRDYGLSSRCEAPFPRDSQCRNHISRVQAAAPRYIKFDNMTIIGQGRNPVYFSPGSSYNRFENSEIAGRSDAVGMYLDAESAHNVIRNNYIHVDTKDHRRSTPQLAIDGSAYNIISGNRFSALNNGGIYLYRNCGEGGNVRHQPPEYNRIINNIFYYNKYTGGNPAIWLSSRNGGRGYCDDENGYPYGSSATNNDLARHNILAENRIIKRSVSDVIRKNEMPNQYSANVTVQSASSRPSNCYDFSAIPTAYINHGQVSNLSSENGTPGCRSATQVCRDGVMVSEARTCRSMQFYRQQNFSCGISSDNAGRRCQISCPNGFTLFAARAACNLETESMSQTLINRQGWGTLKINRASDNISQGECRFGNYSARRDDIRMTDIATEPSVMVSCREHDNNKGDCLITGNLVCSATRVLIDPNIKILDSDVLSKPTLPKKQPFEIQ